MQQSPPKRCYRYNASSQPNQTSTLQPPKEWTWPLCPMPNPSNWSLPTRSTLIFLKQSPTIVTNIMSSPMPSPQPCIGLHSTLIFQHLWKFNIRTTSLIKQLARPIKILCEETNLQVTKSIRNLRTAPKEWEIAVTLQRLPKNSLFTKIPPTITQASLSTQLQTIANLLQEN